MRGDKREGRWDFAYSGRDLDESYEGEELGPIELPTHPEEVQLFADEVEDHNPWYFEKSPFGGPILHSAYTAGNYMRLLSTKYNLYGTIHSKAEHEYLNPARRGKRLFVRGKIAEKANKRGMDYVVVESVTTDEDGVEIARSKDRLIYRYPKRG